MRKSWRWTPSWHWTVYQGSQILIHFSDCLKNIDRKNSLGSPCALRSEMEWTYVPQIINATGFFLLSGRNLGNDFFFVSVVLYNAFYSKLYLPIFTIYIIWNNSELWCVLFRHTPTAFITDGFGSLNTCIHLYLKSSLQV